MNINQNQSQNRFYPELAFYGSLTIATIALVRNFRRMNRYSKEYFQFKKMVGQKYVDLNRIDMNKNSSQKELIVLDNVSPIFPANYFKNIENFSKYKTFQAKFYEGLIFEKEFEGIIRIKGKQNSMYFEMNRPHVGSLVASTARDYDKKGINFHKTQTICVYGYLSYIKDSKRPKIQVQFLGLDPLQITHYWQMKIFANIFSTLYFSILLGLGLSIQKNTQILTNQTLQQITHFFKQIYQKTKPNIQHTTQHPPINT